MRNVLIVVCSFIFIALNAQQSRAQSKSLVARQPGDQDNDQVIEMLDSLVNIRYISRMNMKRQAAPRSMFQPDEIPAYTEEMVKQRLARLQSPIQFTYNDQVQKYIDLYINRRRELSGMTLGLSRLYFPMFEQVLDMYGLPLELKYLAVVESALNPVAVSRVGATGLWQFMYNTGRNYNLEVNSFIDERRDAYKSTVAACQYLKEMYAIYKDWLLVIASYNCGPGNVNKAIIRSGGKMNFWDIAKYLPKETRGYVPAFIAVNYMMNYAPDHNIVPIPAVITYMELDTVQVTKKVSLNEIASTIGMAPELLRFLNPVYKKSIIPYSYDKPYRLILPASKVSAFLTSAESLYKGTEPPREITAPPVLTKTAAKQEAPVSASAAPQESKKEEPEPVKDIRKVHIVRQGDNMDNLAAKYECSVNELKSWNHMNASRLRQGQRLIVYLSAETQERLASGTTSSSRQQTASKTASRPRYIYHVVQRGDTLWTIARKYDGVTVEQLKQMNRLGKSSRLKPGTRLKVGLMT